MTEIHEKLYGKPLATDAEIEAVTAEVERTFDRLSIGLTDLADVPSDLFSEGMRALTAAGYSNLREMDANAFNVWYETLKYLGETLFSLTINKILHSSRDRFRTGRILLGDVIEIAEECYREILITLKDQSATELAYATASKTMGLPRLSPAQHVHRQLLQQTLPALSAEDRMSIKYAPAETGKEIEMSEYDPQSHGPGELF